MNLAMGARREEQFRKFMAAQGVVLERPRVLFAFKWTKYRPDWHDPATGTYYEVVGTRQRGEQLVPTLDLMSIVHPSVEFRIVQPDGTRWMPKRHGLHERLLRMPYGDLMVKRASAEDAGLVDLAEVMGLSQPHLSNILSGKFKVRSWLQDRFRAYGQRTPIPMYRGPERTHRVHTCDVRCLDIMEKYAGGFGTSRIGKVLGMSQAGAYKILKYHRVQTRPVGYLKGKPRPTYVRRSVAL